MEKKKLYFLEEDANTCHPAEYFLRMQPEIIVIEAVPTKDENLFWCSNTEELIDKRIFDQHPCKDCESFSLNSDNARGRACEYYHEEYYEYGDRVTLRR